MFVIFINEVKYDFVYMIFQFGTNVFKKHNYHSLLPQEIKLELMNRKRRKKLQKKNRKKLMVLFYSLNKDSELRYHHVTIHF